MEVIKTEIVHPANGRAHYVVFTVKGSTGAKYRVDMTQGRCSCPGWKFQRADANGHRQPCKHMRQLGYSEIEYKPLPPGAKVEHVYETAKPSQPKIVLSAEQLSKL